MHSDFSDWYRLVSIEPKGEELNKRWEAVEAFSTNASVDDLAEVTRLFYSLPAKNPQFLTKFRGAFKAADETFPMRDNNTELLVLAAAVLANDLSRSGDGGAAVALLVLSADCHGMRKAPVPDLVRIARESVSARSASLRTPEPAENFPPLDLSEPIKNLKSALNQNNLLQLNTPLMTIAESLADAVGQMATWAHRVNRQQELRKEESDVLWWLFGEHSRDLSCSFSELKPPAACIVGAKELADLTRSLPGPFAVEAFLLKMLRLAQLDLKNEVSFAEAVSACSLDWQKEFFKGLRADQFIDLVPLHLAVCKSVEADGKKAWHAPFQTSAGFKASLKMSPLDLAVQVYRERLLVRALPKLEASPNG